MDNIKDKQSGFNVESILLTESSFTRKGKKTFVNRSRRFLLKQV